MGHKLCLLCCENFHPEVAAAVAAERWSDVTVAAFPADCGEPPLDWNTVRSRLVPDCTHVVIVGRACLRMLGPSPEGWPPVQVRVQEECFNLVAGATLVAEAIAAGAYLVTPGWLADWRGRLRRLGFGEADAATFFHDFARQLVLLDTGVSAEAATQLQGMATALGLPATRVAVGIDYTRLVLARVVDEWRINVDHEEALARARECDRERADQMAAMDFLARLARFNDETETIAAIKELFHMLFAPDDLYYVRFEQGAAQGLDALPPTLAREIVFTESAWRWTDAGTGFLLRLERGGETLGVLVADRFAFPAFRERYLDLALLVAGVCGLGIENARTYRRMKATEEALRRSEHGLKMAQAIAHVGHWEWDLRSDDMRWSDETFRILGLEPRELVPTRAAFYSRVHADDRERVVSTIDRCNAGDGFDLEFRILMPDGRVRIVHGLGEPILLADGHTPQLVGTFQDVTAQQSAEVLGVLQDITERKELEWRLAREAHTDPLTGCANRRHFLELAGREMARVRRYGGALSLLMLDLDHFKAVNDLHGHHTGDLTLRAFVDACRSALREEDVIGRLGGEEFAVMLPQTAAEEALEAAERLRRTTAEVEVPLDGVPLHVTVSIGVATLTADDSGIESLINRADDALYAAKHTGRNRVIAGQSSPSTAPPG